jgi:VanZ family protein
LIERPSAEAPVGPAHRALRRRKILAWVWVAAWGAVIWSLGGDAFSATETNRWLMPFFRWLFGEIDADTRYQTYGLIRKFAHLTEYGILALLTFRAALIAASRAQLATAAWTALFIVAALAAADEARQTFSPVRTGSPYDVLIDVTGGLIAVAGVIIVSRRLRTTPQMQSSA